MYELIILTLFFMTMLVFRLAKRNEILIRELELRELKINTLESDLKAKK